MQWMLVIREDACVLLPSLYDNTGEFNQFLQDMMNRKIGLL